MEHIEQAGVHSGDSACSLPPYSLSKKIQKKLITNKAYGKSIKCNWLNECSICNSRMKLCFEVNPRAQGLYHLFQKR